MRLRKPQHGLHKILAIPVKPGRAQDKMPVTELFHELFPGKLRPAVCTLRSCRIGLFIRSFPFSVKHIIRGNMHEFCARLACRNT